MRAERWQNTIAPPDFRAAKRPNMQTDHRCRGDRGGLFTHAHTYLLQIAYHPKNNNSLLHTGRASRSLPLATPLET